MKSIRCFLGFHVPGPEWEVWFDRFCRCQRCGCVLTKCTGSDPDYRWWKDYMDHTPEFYAMEPKAQSAKGKEGEEWKQREADAAYVMYGGQPPPPCTCAAFKEALDRQHFEPTIQEFNGHWAFGTLSLPAMKFCPWCGHPVPNP